MKNLTFKTDIKCAGCVARVTSHLDQTPGIEHWSVDLASPDRILTITTEDLDALKIIETVQNAGFKAEALKGRESA